MSEEKKSSLKDLRKPFGPHQIGKLPKPTKEQTKEVKDNFRAGIRCQVCGQWHHPKVVHLDYVGHAALTDRLLDVDPNWNWGPLAFDPIEHLPLFDKSGGLWIKLTVLGLTRLGYGHAPSKTFQDQGAREKEVIGDALRNAGMRFGMALDLWHKGDLHRNDDPPKEDDKPPKTPKSKEPEPQKNPSNSPTEAISEEFRNGVTDERLVQLKAWIITQSNPHLVHSFDKCVQEREALVSGNSEMNQGLTRNLEGK